MYAQKGVGSNLQEKMYCFTVRITWLLNLNKSLFYISHLRNVFPIYLKFILQYYTLNHLQEDT